MSIAQTATIEDRIRAYIAGESDEGPFGLADTLFNAILANCNPAVERAYYAGHIPGNLLLGEVLRRLRVSDATEATR